MQLSDKTASKEASDQKACAMDGIQHGLASSDVEEDGAQPTLGRFPVAHSTVTSFW